jgi:hypothetical protein
MELLAKIKVDNIYKSKDFTDKKTGETTPGKWKIQTFEKIKSENGDQMKLIDISIPEERVKDIKDKVGQIVTIPVGTFIQGNKVGYYGV